MRPPILPRLLIAALTLATALAAVGWWLATRHIESTDDAYVEADLVPVNARLAGHVRTVDVLDHEDVVAGTQLLSIEPADFQLLVERAQALVEARHAAIARSDSELRLQQAVIEAHAAQVRRAQAEARRTQLDAERFERLAAERVVARQLQERAVAEADQAHAQLIAAQAAGQAEALRLQAVQSARREAVAALNEAHAALHLARLDLERTVVRAPAGGVVANRAVRVGQYVRPGTQLLVLVPLACSYVVANFKETQLSAMRPGQPVTLEVDAYPGATLHGRVASVAPASGAQFALLPPENATGNFRKIVQRVPVRIELEAVPGSLALRPGLSVVVSVDTRTLPVARAQPVLPQPVGQAPRAEQRDASCRERLPAATS